jgi:hypothetical protein
MKWLPSAALLAATLAATLSACAEGADSLLVPGQDGTPASPSGTAPGAPGAPGGLPPGITSGSAKEFFVKKVSPELNAACGSCHTTGVTGAPVFTNADANQAYGMVENRGYIMNGSILVRKGAHTGPAFTPPQVSIVNEWIALELSVRGSKAPSNIFAKLGSCVDVGKFTDIRLDNLRTVKRKDENANQCTGCNGALCVTCHKEGEAGFHSNFTGGGILTAKALQTNSKSADGIYYITKYIATNGTSLTVAPALKEKATATALEKPYGHPMFQVPPEMETALKDFADDVVAKYNAKQCGQ